jgi:hypothetical protein
MHSLESLREIRITHRRLAERHQAGNFPLRPLELGSSQHGKRAAQAMSPEPLMARTCSGSC